MGVKLSEWRLKMTETVTDKLKRIGDLGDRVSMKMNNLQDKLNAKGSKLSADTSRLFGNIKNEASGMMSSFSGMGSSIGSAITNPYVLAGAAVVAFGAKSTSMAMDFQQGMAKINATAQLPKQGLDDLRDKIIDIGRNSSTDMQALPAAYEKILSQTNDVNMSLDVLKASVKGSQAGFADLDVVAGAVSQSMNLVAKQGIGAQQVLDTFMMAKKVGAGEFEDFANYMPGLIAAGNNLGVSFNNTAGTFAYMTSMGQSAADSAMLMQNLFTVLGKGEVQKNLKNIGVSIFNKDGSMRELDSIFSDLSGKMAGLSDQGKSNLLEKLGIQDMQAKSAFSVMISDAGKLKSTMDQVRNSAGDADRTLEATANPMRTMAEIGNMFKGVMLDLGNAILPYVTSFLEWGRDLLSGWITRVRDMWSKSSLIKDIFWVIGKTLSWIWDLIVGIGKLFMWVFDHTVKPIYEAVNWIYDKIKEILGFGKEEVKIQAKIDTEGKVTASAAPKESTASMPGSTTKAPSLTDKDVAGMGGKEGNKGLNAVSGGGSQIRNVIIHMKNDINIRGTEIKQNSEELKAFMLKTLVEVAQGAELTLAN